MDSDDLRQVTLELDIEDRQYEQKERRADKAAAYRLKKADSTNLIYDLMKARLDTQTQNFPVVISHYNRRRTDEYAPSDYEMVKETARCEAIYLRLEREKKMMANLYQKHIEGKIYTTKKRKIMYLLPIRITEQAKKKPLTWLTRTTSRQRVRPNVWREEKDMSQFYIDSDDDDMDTSF